MPRRDKHWEADLAAETRARRIAREKERVRGQYDDDEDDREVSAEAMGGDREEYWRDVGGGM